MARKTWIAIVLATLVLAAGTALCTLDSWMFTVLDPGAFDSQRTPPAPDYTSASAWAALPTSKDGADVEVSELPASDQLTAPAAVFFVHPTTWLGGEWNGPHDDPEVVEATHRGATLIQASAFNACCAVYAPRYRQANGNAFTRPSDAGDRAIDVAYGDVLAAFERFLEIEPTRPFILASHSQGTALAARLLRERIASNPVGERLVVAYLIGGPVWPEDVDTSIPICDGPEQTGCVVAFNARAPDYEPNGFEFRSRNHPEDPIAGRVCVNPLTWQHNEDPAPASANRGGLFFDTENPRVIPEFTDATCSNGALVLSTIQPLERDFMSRLLLWLQPGNYHPIEYQLFYVNLRENAVARTEAYLRSDPTGPTS